MTRTAMEEDGFRAVEVDCGRYGTRPVIRCDGEELKW